jgi:hypothetical protein
MTKDLFIHLESCGQTLICILALNTLQCLQIPGKVMRPHNRIFVSVTQENFCGQETFAVVATCCEIFVQICTDIVE